MNPNDHFASRNGITVSFPVPYYCFIYSCNLKNANNWTVVRLMVNLTQPAMLCFGKVPDDPVFRHHFLEVTSHLQAYKEVVWGFFSLFFNFPQLLL